MGNRNEKDKPCQMVLHHMVHLIDYQTMRGLEHYGINIGQAGILFVLSNGGALSQRELAEKICVKPPSMTVALRKMEKLGFVLKNTDSRDQRITRIELTERGKSCVKEIKEHIDQMEDVLFQGFSDGERILMCRMLRQMQENLMNYKEMKDISMDRIMREMEEFREE